MTSMVVKKILRVTVATVLFLIAVDGLPTARAASVLPQKNKARTSEQAEEAVAAGIAALQQGSDAAAKAAFRRALAADPENVDAHTYLGILADREGDLKEAEKHFAAVAATAPFLPAARNNYGAILMRAGRLQLAAAQFEASLKLDANQPSALVNLAQIRFNGGGAENLRQARELFARALAVAPDAEIARSLVVTSLRLEDRAAAARAYADYVARLNTAADSPARAPRARAELGAVLVEGGLTDEGIAELKSAAEAEPSNTETLILLARAHLKRKEIPAAGKTLEAAVARGLDAAPIYAALADVYEAGGYIENAIPAMRLAIARDPRNEGYHFRYGMLLNDTSAPTAAVIRLQEALKEFPSSSRLWLALGIARLSNNEGEEALKAFQRALELDPKFAPALAYTGMAYTQRGQYAEAIALYERAIAADNRLPAVYYLAADTLLKQPDVDAARAENYLKRAIELDSQFAPARLTLGKLHVRGERWPEAAQELERAVQLDPNLAEAYYQLGRVYTRLKRTTEAQTALATFKRLNETQKEQKENEQRELVRRLAKVRF